MKIGIIGPGALGCLFASRLFLATTPPDSILLIDYDSERASVLNSQGIYYEHDGNIRRLAIPVVADLCVIASCDILFCCVKSYHLEQTLLRFSSLLSPDTLFIFLQNGISHLTYTEPLFPCIPVFGSSTEGASRTSPGHIRHAGKGHSYLGVTSAQNDSTTKRLHKVSALLCKGAIDTTISDDIISRIWAKLFINVGINALTAINNCRNGELLTSDSTITIMKQLIREAMVVAQGSAIQIHNDPITETLSVCNKTASNISSMLQDVRMQRPTEIKAINGAISRLGRERNIATPYNDNIVQQILSLEKEYHEHSNR